VIDGRLRAADVRVAAVRAHAVVHDEHAAHVARARALELARDTEVVEEREARGAQELAARLEAREPLRLDERDAEAGAREVQRRARPRRPGAGEDHVVTRGTNGLDHDRRACMIAHRVPHRRCSNRTLTRVPEANDLDLYEREAHGWWDPKSPAFRSLQSVNALRTDLLREWLGAEHAGRQVVDLACGGGLLSKCFVDGGARVVGIDISRASLRVAHARLGACFAQGDALHAPIATQSVDFVLMSDMLEHVDEPARVVAEAARILRPGGKCFVSTLNRTLRARVLGVWAAEGLGLVPRGTHDAHMFIAPKEIERWATNCGLELERLQGEALDWVRTLRRWTVVLKRGSSCAVTYSALLRKPA
jgi:2-polyprenyl-6-hydroxyphenyl methylase/3-demethylubiquinone-9 3-methyltransferase